MKTLTKRKGGGSIEGEKETKSQRRGEEVNLESQRRRGGKGGGETMANRDDEIRNSVRTTLRQE